MTMDPFEEQLKHALGREQPRTGFALRVRARIADQKKKAPRAGRPWLPLFEWILGILLCVGIVAGVAYRHQTMERARGETAKQQVYVALRLAGAKMQLAESKVRHF